MEKKFSVIRRGSLYMAVGMATGAILDIVAIWGISTRSLTLFACIALFIIATAMSVGYTLYFLKERFCEYVYFTDIGVRYKNTVIPYRDMRITLVYKQIPGLRSFSYYVYFDRNYLTKDDLKDAERIYMTVNHNRLEAALVKYKESIEIIPTSSVFNTFDSIKIRAEKHNEAVKR